MCMCVCNLPSVYSRRLWYDRDNIWHIHEDSSPNGSGQTKKPPCVIQGRFGGGGGLGGQKLKNLE